MHSSHQHHSLFIQPIIEVFQMPSDYDSYDYMHQPLSPITEVTERQDSIDSILSAITEQTENHSFNTTAIYNYFPLPDGLQPKNQLKNPKPPRTKKKDLPKSPKEFSFILKEIRIRIVLEKYDNFFNKQVLIVPFSSTTMQQPILISLKTKIDYNLEKAMKTKIAKLKIQSSDIFELPCSGKLKYKKLLFCNFPRPSFDSGLKKEIIRRAIGNILIHCMLTGDESIVMPGVRVNGIPDRVMMSIIFQETMHGVYKIKTNFPYFNLKEIIFCTNYNGFYLNWIEWLKATMNSISLS